eukprot:5796619-Amphidinium_carterae.3
MGLEHTRDFDGRQTTIDLLKDHLAKTHMAEELHNTLSTLEPLARSAKVVALQESNVNWPMNMRIELVKLACRECPGAYEPSGTDSLWQLVSPFGATDNFDPRSPSVSSAGLSGDDVSKLMGHVLVEKCLFDNIKKGKSAEPMVLALLESLFHGLKAGRPPHHPQILESLAYASHVASNLLPLSAVNLKLQKCPVDF